MAEAFEQPCVACTDGGFINPRLPAPDYAQHAAVIVRLLQVVLIHKCGGPQRAKLPKEFRSPRPEARGPLRRIDQHQPDSLAADIKRVSIHNPRHRARETCGHSTTPWIARILIAACSKEVLKSRKGQGQKQQENLESLPPSPSEPDSRHALFLIPRGRSTTPSRLSPGSRKGSGLVLYCAPCTWW